MSILIETLPGLEYWSGTVSAILDRCDGTDGHVPHRGDDRGLRLTATEMEAVAFPRKAVARILADHNRALGAPEASLATCAKLARPGTLAVVTGQQPMPAGGPLMIFYKALTCIQVARRAERLLGVPVVPLFWNASEDHDLDEMVRVSSINPRGQLHPLAVDLEAWRGRSAAAVGPDPAWQEAVRTWLARNVGPEVVEPFGPRPEEGWSRSFGRILVQVLGAEGLAVVEPHWLRAPAAPLVRRVLEGWREVAALLEASWAERHGKEYIRSFGPMEGPPLFLEHRGLRRRLLWRDGAFRLRGAEATFGAEALPELATLEPERFSYHGALRPLVQNSLLPVVAAVLGPGEITYYEELYRFHAAGLGAGRRMPPIVPRLSATVLDPRCTATMERFGLGPADPFLEVETILERFLPAGELTEEVGRIGEATRERLTALAERAGRLEPTLKRQFDRTGDKIGQALERLGTKLGAVEAEVKGFAPDKLRRLANYVRPGGGLQERIIPLARFAPLTEPATVEQLLIQVDPFRPHHHLLRLRT